MKDQFQRTIDYARISITDRCNLYCTYCRPDHEEMLSHGEILRYEEILRVCKILTTLGIDKFKITGGEPLVRKGCSDFIRELKKTDGVNKVTLTTNGILLSKDLVKLAEAGVDGINISLDFMDQEKYKKITGFDGYKQVISVINKAVNIGLNIKINVVLTEQTTMEDIQKFIDYMKDNGIGCDKHYPVPCHLQEAYRSLGYREGDCPNAEYLAKHCVSLPMFPELTDEEQEYIIEKCNEFNP